MRQSPSDHARGRLIGEFRRRACVSFCMSAAGAVGGAAAIAAIAAQQQQLILQSEEEEMTPYTTEDLDG